MLSYAAFQLSMFMFLLGNAFYTSGNRIEFILIWTRICYAGASTLLFTGYLFREAVTENRNKIQKILFFILFLFLGLLVFLPGEFLFTHIINDNKSHSTLIKGPLFLTFILIIILFSAFHIISIISFMQKNKHKKLQLKILTTGLTLWFLTLSFDGITQPQLWRR